MRSVFRLLALTFAVGFAAANCALAACSGTIVVKRSGSSQTCEGGNLQLEVAVTASTVTFLAGCVSYNGSSAGVYQIYCSSPQDVTVTWDRNGYNSN